MQKKGLILGIAVICLIIGLGQGQWLETTIYLPDSLSGISRPQAFTYNATNNKIYVGGEYGDGVIVIDGATNQVIATIPVGDGPCALIWNSTNNKVYCANIDSDNVTVIDGATNQVITTIPVGDAPRALVWNSTNNKVYCANIGSDNVTVIDGATNQVITTIPVGDGPRAFAWNSIQNRTYVANWGSSSISVIRDEIPGIEENRSPLSVDRSPLEIYPNPAKAVIRVRYSLSVKDKAELKIFDVSGKLIKGIVLMGTDQEIKIPLKGMNPGIYFLQLGNEAKRFVIVK